MTPQCPIGYFYSGYEYLETNDCVNSKILFEYWRLNDVVDTLKERTNKKY